MKKLKWRLFLHFSWQFLSISALMVIVIFLTIIIAVGITTQNESQYNYYQTKLVDITMGTGNSMSELKMIDGWDKDLKKENIWVQIINEEGQVVESSNVPDEIPKEYSQHDLLRIQQTKQLQGYSLNYYLETFFETPHLFLMGHKDKALILLEGIIQDNGYDGVMNNQDISFIAEKLEAVSGSLELYDGDGILLQTIGKGPKREKELPLDVFVRDTAPDVFLTKKTTYRDPYSGILWVLYTPNDNKKEMELNNYRSLLIPFAVTGAVILFITIIISIWNGFRYGNPLFVFSNWLRRMGNEQYGEVLTERERKQVFRKNGKTKWKYRLYEEVFNSFYEMAEKLEVSRKERDRLEKTREEWMTGISHDLRTPLSTMQGYGKLLESGQYDWSKEELEDIGKTICEKSDHMMGLIEDFSLSFQLKNEAAPATFRMHDVKELIMDILSKFSKDRTFEDYPITFKHLNHSQKLQVDERLFERMIDNLIYNAIKHNPPGTRIIITMKVDEQGDKLRISIQDNGMGMDEETLKHLFSRYYRGTNTDERIEGTGLGMNIAMQIAKLHKGTLFVESKEQVGTSVIIDFPLS